MIKINLLPHREMKKEQARKRFTYFTGLFAAITIGLAFFLYVLVASLLSFQKDRNETLAAEIAALETKQRQIEGMKEKLASLEKRKSLIEKLGEQKYNGVVLFNSLQEVLPDGIQLKKVEQKAGSLLIFGETLSNVRIANFLASLNNSKLFAEPSLLEVKLEDRPSGRVNVFSLDVNQIPPKFDRIEKPIPAQAAVKNNVSNISTEQESNP